MTLTQLMDAASEAKKEFGDIEVGFRVAPLGRKFVLMADRIEVAEAQENGKTKPASVFLLG